MVILIVSLFFISNCGYFKIDSTSSKKTSSSTLSSSKNISRILTITSSLANGRYKAGDIIDISIEFTQPVIVSGGIPTLSLNAGPAAKAVYLSGSNSNILIFRYTIAPDESSVNLNYISTSALILNDALIRDSNNDEVILDLPPIGLGTDLGSMKTISIDAVAPTIPTELADGVWSNSLNQTPIITFLDSTDNQSNIVTYKAKIIDNNLNADVMNFTPISSGSRFSGLNLLNGHNYSVVLKAIDSVGNESLEVTSNGWTIDTIPPTIPGIITTGVVPANFTQSTPVFTFSNSIDDMSGVSRYEIEINKKIDGSNVKPYMIVIGNGTGLSFTDTASFLTPGESYFVNIRAVDVAGNIGSVRSTSGSPWIALLCPTNYIYITPRTPFTLVGFCVAKFEMKIQGNDNGNIAYSEIYNAESRPNGTPWVNINRPQSIAKCQSLGTGYDLISNAQWQTLAQNAEMNPRNWIKGIVGVELMYEGHSDNVPPNPLEVTNIADNYNLTGNNSADPADIGKNQRRTMEFTNGVEIWDLAGNVTEWVKDDISTFFSIDNFASIVNDLNSPITGSIGGLSGTAKFLFGPLGDYQSLQVATVNYGGFGRITLNSSPVTTGSTSLMRGGRWSGDNYVGVFRTFQAAPTSSTNQVGFRCVYTAQ